MADAIYLANSVINYQLQLFEPQSTKVWDCSDDPYAWRALSFPCSRTSCATLNATRDRQAINFFEQSFWFPTKCWRHPLQIWKDEGCPYIAMHLILSMLGLGRMCFHLSPMYRTNVRRNYHVTLWPSVLQCQTSDTKSRGTKCCHNGSEWWAMMGAPWMVS